MKLAPITVTRQPDGSYILTASAPRDGVGRQGSGGDYNYIMTEAQCRTLVADLQWLMAGEGR